MKNLDIFSDQELKSEEVVNIEGGNFLKDIGYAVGYTAAVTIGGTLFTVVQAARTVAGQDTL